LAHSHISYMQMFFC